MRITDMTGRHLEAALRFFPPTLTGPSGRWGALLRERLQKFRAAGGQPNDRIASRVELSPRVVLEWMDARQWQRQRMIPLVLKRRAQAFDEDENNGRGCR